MDSEAGGAENVSDVERAARAMLLEIQQQIEELDTAEQPLVVEEPPSAAPLRAIYFTGNEGKYQEAQHVVKQLRGNRLVLERVKVDLPELQGSPEEIAVAKTLEAARQLEGNTNGARFLITDDSGLCLDCLNGFPGVYIKPMLEQLGDVGIGGLVARYADRGARATCTLGVIDLQDNAAARTVQTYEGQCLGHIEPVPRGDVKHGKLSWNTIFVPVGFNTTFGELQMEQHAEMSHRRDAFAKWLDVLMPNLNTIPH